MNHTVLTRGPEGEQLHKDKHGKAIKGEGSVQFVGLERYEKELRRRAGLPEDNPEPKLPADPKAKRRELLRLAREKGLADV